MLSSAHRFLLLSTVLRFMASVDGETSMYHDRILSGGNAKNRHNIINPPPELNVDPKNTYNDKFMALMQSPCRPEYDGYFGATSGTPTKIQYGFRLETMPLSSIMDMLDLIEDKLVDAILSSSFPQMCGYRRRNLGHASGFRFMKFNEIEKCTPETSPVNFCGIFTGEVSVFGKDQGDSSLQVMSMLKEILNPLDPSRWHPELALLMPVEEHFEIISDVPDESRGVKIENLLWAGLAIVLLMVTMCMWWFCRNMKQGDTMLTSTESRRGKRTWNRFFRRHQRRMEYNPEAKSIRPSLEPDAEAFGGGMTGAERTSFLNRDHFDDDEFVLDSRAKQGII